MEGKYPAPTPAVCGHESAGVVEAVGDQVTYVRPGDHVITCLSVYCGNCEHCLTGHLSLCENKAAVQRAAGAPSRLQDPEGRPLHQMFDMGSYAEEMLIHEHGLVKINPEMPLDRAALIGCGVTTGLGAVFNTAKVSPGEIVVVLGAGGIGLNCIQGARIAGAGRVIAVDMLASKLQLATQFGATDVVDASAGDAVAQVRELSGGGVHHAFEAIGLKATAEQAFAMLRRGGAATVIGMIPVGQTVEVMGYELLYEKKLQGSNMGSNRFRVDMPRYVDLYLQGRLMLDELVSRRITLDEINDGFDAMKAGEVARSVITFG
jgi:S-(hydroxymethyl)glutathione dehydrogenase/alcohol dehydrogenase